MDDLISRQAVLTEIFKKPAWHNSDGSYYYADDIRDAVNSVKPQEPTTVLYSGDGYADGEMVYNMAECPNCGYEYENGDKDWGLPFCPSCGQALKWEVEQDADSN